MRIQFPRKRSILIAMKIFAGLAATIAAFSNGIYIRGCPLGTFCKPLFDDFSVMRMDIWSIGIVLLAIGLLLSALKDILSNGRLSELADRDVEAIAPPINDSGDF